MTGRVPSQERAGDELFPAVEPKRPALTTIIIVIAIRQPQDFRKEITDGSDFIDSPLETAFNGGLQVV